MEPQSFLRLGVRRIAGLLQHFPVGVSGRVAVLLIRLLYRRDAAALAQSSGPTVPQGMAALSVLPDDGFRDSLSRLEVPVLLLNGATDWLVRRYQEGFAAACRDGSLVSVPRAGHLLPMELPDAFTNVLETFVGRLP